MTPREALDRGWLSTPPRQAAPSRLNRVLVATLALIGGLLLALAALLAYFDVREVLLLQRGGVTTQGVVTGRWEMQSRGSTSYRLDYSFRVNGREYRGQDPVPRPLWDATAPGDAVPVVYFPGDPEAHRLGSTPDAAEGQQRVLFWGGMLLLIVLLFGLLTYFQVREIKRQLALMRQGLLVEAEVTDIRPIPGTQIYRLRYRFPQQGEDWAEGAVRIQAATAARWAAMDHLPVLVLDRGPGQRPDSLPVDLLTAVQPVTTP